MSGLRHSTSVRPRDDLLFLEYPFITLKTFPQGFLQRIGELQVIKLIMILPDFKILVRRYGTNCV